jgi:hypothetical protein
MIAKFHSYNLRESNSIFQLVAYTVFFFVILIDATQRDKVNFVIIFSSVF